MSQSLSISAGPSYIHVRLAPGFEITPASMDAQWTAVAAACQESNLYRVLVEGRIAARKMETIDALDSAAMAAKLIPGMTCALCFYDYQTDELSQFFSDAAYNRGARVRFFTEQPAALQWLQANPAESSPGREVRPDRRRQANGGAC